MLVTTREQLYVSEPTETEHLKFSTVEEWNLS
jgi:hypothetical protein